MIGGEDHCAKYAEDFRKHFQKVIQYKGKARAHAASVFKEQVLDAGGVRFFVKFEQVCQMVDQGLEKIMTQILPVCNEHKWSEESTSKMMLKYGAEENSAQLGMAMIETAAVVDYGKCFAESCYTLEGDSAMVLRGSAVFERLETTIVKECPLDNVHKVIDRVVELINKSKTLVSQKKRLAEGTCHAAFLELHTCKDKIKALQSERSSALGSTS